MMEKGAFFGEKAMGTEKCFETKYCLIMTTKGFCEK